MIKKISLVTLIIVFSMQAAFAENLLRQPQGRLGTSFKTERIKYPSTNLSPQELEKLHKNIEKYTSGNSDTKPATAQKRQSPEKLQAKKQEDMSLKDLQRQKLAEKKQIATQQAKDEKEQQKIKLAEQKQNDIKQKQIEKEHKAEQDRAESIKKQEEKEKLAAQKAEEKRLKQEEKEKAALARQNQKEGKKESKLSFKFRKKDKNKVEEENIVQEQKPAEPEQSNFDASKYVQDNGTKNIVKEITTELSNERPQMLQELSTLWVSAVQKSDTVYFAIMKLSNPNGEEVNKNGFKKILEPILGAAPLVGQAFVNPALAAGSIIGSNVMGTMINDGVKTRLAKVNDADLVILARAIDELQESLLMNYMAYKGAKEEYELAIKIAAERQKEYEEMNKKNSPNTILANTFYTEALDYQYKTRQEFLMKRVVLEQMVGAEALNEIENPSQQEEKPSEATETAK